MNLLNKLTIKNLKLNKKRTIVTIIGIILSVALITAVSTMYSSLIKTFINYEVYEKGRYHVAFYDVPKEDVNKIKNNREVKNIYITKNIGYAKLENSKNEYKPYIFVKAFNGVSLKNLSVKLIKGRLPIADNEILIPTHLGTNGRVVMNIGDEITLDIGKRITLNGEELTQDNPYQKEVAENIIDTSTKTYKIVGLIERPATNIESYTAPGYTFITYENFENVTGNVDIFAEYTKKGSKNYFKITSSILGVNEDAFIKKIKYPYMQDEVKEENDKELSKAKYKYNINNYLIDLENKPLGSDSTANVGKVIIIVIGIIIVTSVFCIKNSFDISITEKIKQYGMLRSIGATKKQIRKNVFYEATILGIIGIPLGLLSGVFASYILILVSNYFLKDMIVNRTSVILSYSKVSFLISIILGFITIYLSALRSAHKASLVSLITSIRNSADIKISKNKIKSPKIINKIFKIGGEISYKNMKRNKKKYRTTILSISLSVIVFIALSYFMSCAFNEVDNEIKTRDYNIYLNKQGNKDFEEIAKGTVYLDNIKDYAIYRDQLIKVNNPIYSKDYHEYLKHTPDREEFISIITIGKHQYEKYLKSLKLDYEDMKNKAILIDKVKVNIEVKEKYIEKKMRVFGYKENDIISISNEKGLSNIPIGCITNKLPFGSKNTPVLIISDEMFDNIVINSNYSYYIYYDSTNPNKLQDDIDAYLYGEDYLLTNIAENARIMKNLYTLVAIFLYGFIIVITLIGITNIFNTITTNMSLRRQEFAMLKSIGMTKGEFNNMIRFESIFIGLKSLIISIPIGLALSFLIYNGLNMNLSGIKFIPPYLAIIISIIAVYLLITLIMKYSLCKINKQNTIETIRNENI